MNTGNLPTVYAVRAPASLPGGETDWMVDAVVFSRSPAPAAEACMLRSTRDLVGSTGDPGRMRKVCAAIVGAYRGRHQGAGCFVCGTHGGISCYLVPQEGPLVVVLCCNAPACADCALQRVDTYLDEQAK